MRWANDKSSIGSNSIHIVFDSIVSPRPCCLDLNPFSSFLSRNAKPVSGQTHSCRTTPSPDGAENYLKKKWTRASLCFPPVTSRSLRNRLSHWVLRSKMTQSENSFLVVLEPEVWGQGVGRLGSSEPSLLKQGDSCLPPCPHTASPLCFCVLIHSYGPRVFQPVLLSLQQCFKTKWPSWRSVQNPGMEFGRP